MKRPFFTALFLAAAYLAAAQQNTLLNQPFWQAKPNVEAVKAEVAKGNSPSEFNANSFDPVVLAINGGADNTVVQYLLEQPGNDVNKLTHDGRTYIFWAASKGNTELMEYLIAKGAKVKGQEDSHGFTVANFAANGGQPNTKVYDLCLANGANLATDLTHDGANALLLAVANDNNLTLTEYFISKGLSLQSQDAAGNTAFHYAARAGNMVGMKALLAKGVKFTDNAMLMAAQGGRRGSNGLEVFQYLESLGVKPTATGKTGENVLHAICRRPGQMPLLQHFLSKGVDVNQQDEAGNNVLMSAAAANNDTAMLAAIAAKTKNINLANKAGATALALATRSNSTAAVSYLLQKGAQATTVDAKGNNLAYYLLDGYNARLHEAFEQKWQLLKQQGVNFAIAQKDGNTAYHLATGKNDLALLKIVGAWGADVNAKNKEGLTALHKAAMVAKDGQMMQFLLSVGAKKDTKTGFDETAFDLASENEFLTKQKVAIDFLK